MQQDAYYVIKPTEYLATKLASRPDSPIRFYCQPNLWTKSEGGMTIWTEPDYLASVKLIFLGDLADAYDPNLRVLDFFDGEFATSIEFFDKYWTIERFTAEGDLDQMCINLKYETIKKFVPTGMRVVDGWIEWLEQRAQNLEKE